MSTAAQEADATTRAVHLLKEVSALVEGAFDGPTSGGYRELVERLDELAHTKGRELFALSLTFEPYYRPMLGFDYTDHEWAALLVASAVPEAVDPSVQAGADKLLEDATRSLLAKRDRDRKGPGFAYFVRGKRALAKGRLDEAASFWRLAREVLKGESPVEEMNTAYLAFQAFQDGDLRGCQKVAEEALELAKIRDNRRAEAFSHLLLAFFALYEGSFAQAEAELMLSDSTFEGIEDESQRFEHPLVQTAFGALHAFRGDYAEADRYFAKAPRMTETIALAQRYAAVNEAVRAELTADQHPQRAATDAKAACGFWTGGIGGIWLAWALRGGGVAARARGEFSESLKLLQDAYRACRNPFERGRSLLETGKTLLLQRKVAVPGPVPRTDTATENLKRAADLFSSLQAHYWLTQTYLALAEAEPELSKYWQGKARLTALSDRAYTRLFDTKGNEVAGPDRQLIIRLHGKLGVVVGDFEVNFPTKHAELLVYALALAGRSGEDRSTVIEKLWPAADSKQGSQKLRTALWQAKISLGSEDWRLQRKGERLYLVLDGAYVDDFAARSEIERVIDLGGIVFAGAEERRAPADSRTRVVELKDRMLMNAASQVRPAIDTLEAPLLSHWAAEEWVRKAHADRLDRVAECRRILDEIANTMESVPE